jgi:hypothetical protein
MVDGRDGLERVHCTLGASKSAAKAIGAPNKALTAHSPTLESDTPVRADVPASGDPAAAKEAAVLG